MIREIKNSVVICGTDHFRWVGYAFSDRNIDDNHLNDEDEHDENDGEMPDEDIFASDGNILEYIPVVDDPICDPRMYFLRCAQLRVAAVVDEWKYLIQSVEVGLKDWVSLQLTYNGYRH